MKVSANHLLVVCGDNSVVKIGDYKKGTLVYVRCKRRYMATTLDKLIFKKEKCYKYTFSDGSTLICGGKKKSVFSSFFTYSNPSSFLKTRVIDSISEKSYANLQRNILYNAGTGKDERYVFYKDLPIEDRLDNLNSYSKEDYIEKVNLLCKKYSGFYLANKESNYYYSKNMNSGESNPMFGGVSNIDLINISREFLKNSNYKFSTVGTLLRYLKKQNPDIPLTLGKFRPSYQDFYDHVWNNKPYDEVSSNKIDNKLLYESIGLKKNSLLNYIKDNFYEYVDYHKRKNLKIISVEEIEDIVAEIPKNILIATNDLGENYRSCSGIVCK
ncbi:MAG: hypothetical protein EKK61_00070 [Rickettsiales bacterium]|nr:MAG: hypothetical protein EKK61_00070 [Rickettsiales bacterium]